MNAFFSSLTKAVDSIMGAVGKDAQHESEALQFADVRRIVVDVDAGEVKLAGSDDAGVSLTRTVHFHGDDRPKCSAELDGDTLTLHARNSSKLKNSRIDHVLVAPRDVELQVKLAVGAVSIEDTSGSVDVACRAGGVEGRLLSGDIKISTDAGSVRLDDVAGSLEIKTEAGSVRGEKLTSPTASVKASAGSIRLEWDSAPTTVDAYTNVGSIKLVLPEETYAISTTTSLGSTNIDELRIDSTSERTITARSEVGAVSVQGRAAGEIVVA